MLFTQPRGKKVFKRTFNKTVGLLHSHEVKKVFNRAFNNTVGYKKKPSQL